MRDNVQLIGCVKCALRVKAMYTTESDPFSGFNFLNNISLYGNQQNRRNVRESN